MAKKQNKKTVIRFNFSWIYFLIILGIGYLLFQNSGPGPQKIEWTAVKQMILDGDVKEMLDRVKALANLHYDGYLDKSAESTLFIIRTAGV